jgi:DNA-binding SARP family transcriptional activator/WD40 repeat protein/energy-coupling factor transporter ATP-binding protein EcfA2
VLLGVLGPLLLRGEPSQLGRRDRVVLQVLAARRGLVCSPDDLADALWPQGRPASWVKVIQGVVVRLRRLLGREAIASVPDGYRLALAATDLDLAAFVEHTQRGRSFTAVGEPARALSAYDAALALWRGRPFDDLDDWAPGRAEALQLEDLHLDVQEERLEAALACGRAQEAVHQAQRLVHDAPLRERRWQLLAMAQYGCGRQADALATLQQAARVLREELGLDPGPALAQLEHAVLHQDATLPRARTVPQASGQCPYQGLEAFSAERADLFVGREADVAACLSRLKEQPLLVLVGPSGCGKSSLARAGIGPALARSGRAVTVLAPGPDPLAALADARAASPHGAALVVDQLEELAAGDPDVAEEFLAGVAEWTATAPVVLTVRADRLEVLAASPVLAEPAGRGVYLVAPLTEVDLRRVIEEPAASVGLLLEPGLVDLLLRDVQGEAGGLPLLSHALRETWLHRDGDVLTVDGYRATGGISGAVAQTADALYLSLDDAQQATARSLLLRLVTPTPDGAPVAARLPLGALAHQPAVEQVLDRLVASRLVTAGDGVVGLAHESLAVAWPRLRLWLDDDVDGRRVLGHLQVAASGWASAGRPTGELYRGARLEAALEWRERTQAVLTDDEDAFLAASVHADEDERRQQREALAAQRRTNRRLRLLLGSTAGLLVLALAAGSVAVVARDRAAAASREALAAGLGDVAAREPRADTALLAARQAVALADTPQTSVDLLASLDERSDLVSVRELGIEGFIGAQVQVSPDGDRLLALQMDGVELVDTSSGERLPDGGPLVEGDVPAALYAAGFVDGGATAVVTGAASALAEGASTADAAGECAVRRFSSSAGLPVGEFEVLPGSRCGDFFTMDRPRVSRDGSRLVSLSGAQVRIWDRSGSTWTGPRTLDVPEIDVGTPLPRDLTLSDDGRRALVMAELGNAAPWYRYLQVPVVVDLDAGTLLAPVAPDSQVARGAMAPDGSAVAVGRWDGTVEVRPLAGGPSATLPGPAVVSALRWSSDSSQLLVGRQDGSLDVVGLDPVRLVRRVTGHGDAVVAIQGEDGGTGLLTLDTLGVGVRRDTGPSSALGARRAVTRPHAVAVTPDGASVLVGEEAGRVQVYAAEDLSSEGTLSLGPSRDGEPSSAPEIRQRVSALAATDDAVVAGDRTGNLAMWSWPGRDLLWSRQDVPVAFLAVSPDGRYLATGEFTRQPGDPAPDGVPDSSRLRLWNLAEGTEVASVDTEGKKPRTLVFSPDGEHLVAGFYDEGALVLAVPTGEVEATLDLAVGSAAFRPDADELVLVGFEGTATAVSTSDWSVRRSWPTLAAYTSTAFTPDGTLMLLATPQVLSVWDAADARLLAPQVSVRGDDSNDALMLAVVPSQNRLVVASQSELATIDLDQRRWEQSACDIAGRSLTREEWDRLLPGLPFDPACAG